MKSIHILKYYIIGRPNKYGYSECILSWCYL